jgi:hypothetical protein
VNKTNACLCHEALLASYSLDLGDWLGGLAAGQGTVWGHLEGEEGRPRTFRVGSPGKRGL